jgi:agmatine deiminase
MDLNGRGTVLTTESCLLNANRNPHATRTDIERYLADYCGAPNVLWLDGQLAGDDTDGHVDQLARFANPSTVVANSETDPRDENHEPLRENLRRLRTMRDQDGRALTIVPLPMPRPIEYQGARLPAAYANFYIANRLVIVPQFDDPADGQALETLSGLFPTRRVLGLPAADLAVGLGAYHCLTQPEPAPDK